MLNDKFREQAKDIAETLQDLTKRGHWTYALSDALISKEFEQNEVQLAAIKAASTPTMFADNNTLSSSLTHAFRDPILKNSMLMGFVKDDIYDEEETMNILVQTQGLLEDIVFNYTLLLGEDMPDNVQSILDEYQNAIIPNLDFIIDYLANKAGLDADAFKFDANDIEEGYEHLQRLPADVFEQHIEV